EVAQVESTSGLEWEIEEPESVDNESEKPETPTGLTFEAQVACLDPQTGLLVQETRAIPEAPTRSQRLLQILGSLHDTPKDASRTAAVPPELQFRSVFVDLDRNLVLIDLAGLPEKWKASSSSMEIGQALYAIVHTISYQNPSYQTVQFLVNGRESNESPGGFLLSEPFAPSEDWVKSPAL
ncbi:MAG: GerMN domain-containing protein, partial [Candidatus Omnitrophica bacterium]|nr:GerMN domain-containing protein [Candidatus Omnitrophota bacterium]